MDSYESGWVGESESGGFGRKWVEEGKKEEKFGARDSRRSTCAGKDALSHSEGQNLLFAQHAERGHRAPFGWPSSDAQYKTRTENTKKGIEGGQEGATTPFKLLPTSLQPPMGQPPSSLDASSLKDTSIRSLLSAH